MRISNKELREKILAKDFIGTNLGSGLFTDLDFSNANFNGADIRNSKFYNCNLSRASFYETRMEGTSMANCNASLARFMRAKMMCMHFMRVNFTHADFTHANLHEATLADCDLSDITISYDTIGLQDAPEGELVGWGMKHNYLIKMIIPKTAKRSWATTRKLRAEYVIVESIIDTMGGRPVDTIDHYSDHRKGYSATVYTVGQTTMPDKWDDDRWNECSHGIHFFLDKREALTW